MEKTDWFRPPFTPVHVGIYEICVYDAGWTYEWHAWWDGRHWRDKESGNTLVDQQQTWRGSTTEQTT